MVFECYESLSFSHAFHAVVNVQISSNDLSFFVNSSNRIRICFLVC